MSEPATITPLWSDEETLDLQNFDENAAQELLPNEWFDAVCDEAIFGESKSSGAPMVTLKMKIEDSEHKSFDGRVLYAHCVLPCPQNEMQTFGLKTLKKAGLALNPELNFGAFRPADVPTYFEGNRCKVKIGTGKDKRDGSMRNEIKDWKSGHGTDFWSQ
jgi:hypothetical protein